VIPAVVPPNRVRATAIVVGVDAAASPAPAGRITGTGDFVDAANADAARSRGTDQGRLR